MTSIHCWRCGVALDHIPPTTCGRCGQEHYNNPKPAADAVVVRDGQVMLIRRTRDPWRDHWDIPGGFCEPDEHPIHTAERELREETGFHGCVTAMIGIWIDRYGPPEPAGVHVTTLNVVYLVRLLDGEPTHATDDEASESRWFAFDALPSRLAFPDHAVAALAAARRLLTVDPPPPLLDRP